MLMTPNGLLPASCSVIAAVFSKLSFLSLVFANDGWNAPFHGHFLKSPPFAAYSHSASVGSLRPIHLQNAPASSQVTPTTGWSSAPSSESSMYGETSQAFALTHMA